MNEQIENTAQQAPPARPRRRYLRLLLALLILAVPIGAGTWWVLTLPPGMGPLAAMRSAGLPVPAVLMATFEPQSLPSPLDAIPALEIPAAAGEGNAPAASGEAPSLAASLSAIEGTLRAHELIQRELTEQLQALAEENARMTAELEARGQRLAQLEAASAGLVDAVQLARDEAQHARSLAETITGQREARLELVETDVFALASALKTSRAVASSLSERIDALAADLHLVARFGSEQAPAAPVQPAATISTAPFQSNYHGSASEAAEAAPPAAVQPVQGQYRVGDWVAGWGVVSSIRRTPDGDHLTTPRGIVFAPPAASEE